MSASSGARRRRRPWLRRLAWLAAVPLLLLLGFAASLFVVALVAVPLPDGIDDAPAVVLDTSGEPYAQLGSEFARRDVPLGEVPQHLIDAVLAAEDSDFYQHPGVSVTSVARAAISNVVSRSVEQGGSTITQQYVKVVTADDEQTFWRKVREAALAVKLERTHSKQEILELYLNTVYFGRGAYGVQAAAQAYFARDVGQLDVAQSALLAGLLPAPSRYDPLVGPEAAAVRYGYVLTRMVEEGWLDQPTSDLLRSQPPPATVPRAVAERDDAPWFTDLVRLELERLGFGDARGLTVHTTLNLGVQRHAERAYADAFASDGAGPAAAIVAADPGTGGILAVVGGADYTRDQLNLARAQRQPGSTFKTMALAAWIADGRSPETQMAAPGSIVIPDADGGSDWSVANYGGRDLGRMSLRQATWRSSNTAYAQAAVEVGVDRVADMSNRLLGRSGEESFPAFASLVLGTAEVTPVELTGAYTALAAGGVHHDPHTVQRVSRDGVVIYEAPSDGDEVLTPEHAAIVTDVLRGVISDGTGQAASIGRPAAGKTGTTQDYGDAWFAGYTPQVAAVVWMGNRDDRSPLPGEETGGGTPARVWAAFMTAVHEGLAVIDFPVADVPSPDTAPVAAPTPTESPSATPTPTPTPSPSVTPIATPTPQVTDAPEPPSRPTPAPAPTPTAAPAPQPRPTATGGPVDDEPATVSPEAQASPPDPAPR